MKTEYIFQFIVDEGGVDDEIDDFRNWLFSNGNIKQLLIQRKDLKEKKVSGK